MTSSGADIEPRAGAFAQTAPCVGREMHVRDVRTDGRDGTRENYRGDSRARRERGRRLSPGVPGGTGGAAAVRADSRRGSPWHDDRHVARSRPVRNVMTHQRRGTVGHTSG